MWKALVIWGSLGALLWKSGLHIHPWMYAEIIWVFDLEHIKVIVERYAVVSSSSIWPNLAHLRDINFQNLSNLDIDLSRLLRSNVITWTPDIFFRINV